MDIDQIEADKDELREIALERGILAQEHLQFLGKPIRPITAGSMAMLQRIKNGIIFGSTSNILFDAAGFVLIHIDEEKHFRKVRRAVFDGDWSELVIDWLDSTPNAQAELTRFAPHIAQMRNDYAATLTRQLEGSESGNDGGRTG